MPYTNIAIAICIVVGFYKIGDVDEEIGNPLGLIAGLLVVLADFLYPGGYSWLIIYAFGGYVLLFIYKILRGIRTSRIQPPQEKKSLDDEDDDADEE